MTGTFWRWWLAVRPCGWLRTQASWRLWKRSEALEWPCWAWAALQGNEAGCVWWRALLHASCCAGERQKHQELIFMWEYNQHFHNNCKIVVIRPTLIKGVCLVCLPLSCLPNLVGRQLWLKDLGVPLLSSPSTAAENLWRVSAFFSAILETKQDFWYKWQNLII